MHNNYYKYASRIVTGRIKMLNQELSRRKPH